MDPLRDARNYLTLYLVGSAAYTAITAWGLSTGALWPILAILIYYGAVFLTPVLIECWPAGESCHTVTLLATTYPAFPAAAAAAASVYRELRENIWLGRPRRVQAILVETFPYIVLIVVMSLFGFLVAAIPNPVTSFTFGFLYTFIILICHILRREQYWRWEAMLTHLASADDLHKLIEAAAS